MDNQNHDPAFDQSAAVPDVPSDDEIRQHLLRTAENFPTLDNPQRETPLDLSGYSPELQEKARQARFRLGPGEHANDYQRAVHAQAKSYFDLQAEAEKLSKEMVEVRGYDKDGAPLYVRGDTERRAISVRIAGIEQKMLHIVGEPGRAELAAALEGAVLAEKAKAQRGAAYRRAKLDAVKAAKEEKLAEISALVDKAREARGVPGAASREKLSEIEALLKRAQAAKLGIGAI